VLTATVIAPSWLGDAIMCLPTLARLRAAQPDCDWTVMARPSVAPVFAMAEMDLRVRTLPAPPSLSFDERPPRTDAVLVLPNSFYSAMLAWRMSAAQRIGYARDRRSWLLRPAVAVPEPGAIPAHESFYYLELVHRAGLIPELPPESALDQLRVPLHPDAGDVKRWRQRLGPGPLVAIHPGAASHSAKRWLPERFAALAAALANDGAQVLLVGSESERELTRNVRMLAARPFQIKNLAGETTLPSLAALLRAADLLVANDSGPMHLAAAVGTPVVALFGPTNEHATHPLAEPGKLRLVSAAKIECRPCKLDTCPIDHRCMDRIGVATVLAAAREVLAESRIKAHA
jgi:heptosyltransferase-2